MLTEVHVDELVNVIFRFADEVDRLAERVRRLELRLAAAGIPDADTD